MAITVKRKGYGQVEPNHLSAQYNGKIYAQLPAKVAGGATPIAQLENGQFLKYNYAGQRASTDGDGEWMLVFNEVKLYDERRQRYKDFCMKASEMTDGTIYPRLLKTDVGDIFTTNTFGAAAAGPDDVQESGVTLAVGNYVTIGSDGFLAKSNAKPESGICFQVVQEYNLGDMQEAVKLQRIQ